MNYYQRLLTDLSVPESAVNCGRCPSEWKCCTYRPFIANFLAGPASKLREFDESLFSEWDFLIAGLAPNMKYRKHFSKKGKWGFGSDMSLLCSFYDKSSGGCQIWSSRAAVCRTFFCKSSYGDQGLSYWKGTEEFSWLLEWTLLEDFLFHKGWTLEDVKTIKTYLHEDTVVHQKPLPQEYRFQDVPTALAFYDEAAAHVNGMTEEYVKEILGEQGRKWLADLLADIPKLR